MAEPEDPNERSGGEDPDGQGGAAEALGPIAGVILGFLVWRLLPVSLALPLRAGLVLVTVAIVVWLGIQLAARRR